MNNLAHHLKSVDEIHISKKERKYLLREAINTAGERTQLIIANEEISELMNVLSDNILHEFDYLHTAEEVTDVLISMKMIAMIADVQLPKNSTRIPMAKQKLKIFSWYSNLTKAQQYISKYMRHGSVSKDKLVLALHILDDMTYEIIEFCKISKKDIAKIETLKMKRLQDRLRHRD